MMFKVGDKVWDVRFGNGRVVEKDPTRIYSIAVYFSSGKQNYTEGGVYGKEENRSLFFEEIKIPASALYRPYAPSRGDLVVVENSDEEKIIVHFDYMLEDGSIQSMGGDNYSKMFNPAELFKIDNGQWPMTKLAFT